MYLSLPLFFDLLKKLFKKTILVRPKILKKQKKKHQKSKTRSSRKKSGQKGRSGDKSFKRPVRCPGHGAKTIDLFSD